MSEEMQHTYIDGQKCHCGHLDKLEERIKVLEKDKEMRDNIGVDRIRTN